MHYTDMQVGERYQLPVVDIWEGQNRNIYNEMTAYVAGEGLGKHFEVETIRHPKIGDQPVKPMEFWVIRTM